MSYTAILIKDGKPSSPVQVEHKRPEIFIPLDVDKYNQEPCKNNFPVETYTLCFTTPNGVLIYEKGE